MVKIKKKKCMRKVYFPRFLRDRLSATAETVSRPPAASGRPTPVAGLPVPAVVPVDSVAAVPVVLPETEDADVVDSAEASVVSAEVGAVVSVEPVASVELPVGSVGSVVGSVGCTDGSVTGVSEDTKANCPNVTGVRAVPAA